MPALPILARTPTRIARCTTRVSGADPVEYFSGGPDYDLAPDDRLRVELPTALLIDGRSISAGDYFARAVDIGTDARIFGRPSAGAYGGGGLGRALVESPDYYLAYDPYRCNDEDGEALETHSTIPDELIDYAPGDLAAGRDTVLDRAAEWALSEAE